MHVYTKLEAVAILVRLAVLNGRHCIDDRGIPVTVDNDPDGSIRVDIDFLSGASIGPVQQFARCCELHLLAFCVVPKMNQAFDGSRALVGGQLFHGPGEPIECASWAPCA